VIRRARVAVVVAVVVTVAGVAVRPLLNGRPPRHLAQRGVATTATRRPDTSAVGKVATAAAVRALACDPVSANAATARGRKAARWCGRYTISRQQTRCPTEDLCTVELLGTLTSRTASILVGLAVTVRRDTGGWAVTAVRS